MKTIKLELSVKLLMGAIALGLFLNVFKDFPPSANAYDHVQRVTICNESGGKCVATGEYNDQGYNVLLTHNLP
ncbi:hypothetical protein OAC15_04145 [Alphaproteobacteria bacterium]|nr:hypothetical protein [Alphaproteobacteria bacterium]